MWHKSSFQSFVLRVSMLKWICWTLRGLFSRGGSWERISPDSDGHAQQNPHALRGSLRALERFQDGPSAAGRDPTKHTGNRPNGFNSIISFDSLKSSSECCPRSQRRSEWKGPACDSAVCKAACFWRIPGGDCNFLLWASGDWQQPQCKVMCADVESVQWNRDETETFSKPKWNFLFAMMKDSVKHWLTASALEDSFECGANKRVQTLTKTPVSLHFNSLPFWFVNLTCARSDDKKPIHVDGAGMNKIQNINEQNLKNKWFREKNDTKSRIKIKLRIVCRYQNKK